MYAFTRPKIPKLAHPPFTFSRKINVWKLYFQSDVNGLEHHLNINKDGISDFKPVSLVCDNGRTCYYYCLANYNTSCYQKQEENNLNKIEVQVCHKAYGLYLLLDSS